MVGALMIPILDEEQSRRKWAQIQVGSSRGLIVARVLDGHRRTLRALVRVQKYLRPYRIRPCR